MSNRPWPEKRSVLEKVQFQVTSSVADVEVWNEAAIQSRGYSLAERSAKAITSPLPRTRDYRSKAKRESSTGLYPLLQGDSSLAGTYLRAVLYNGERKECITWSRLLCVVGDFLYSENPALFAEVVGDIVWYSKDKSSFQKAAQVPDSPWFCCGGGYSGEHFRNIAARLAEGMGCLSDIQLEVINPAMDE